MSSTCASDARDADIYVQHVGAVEGGPVRKEQGKSLSGLLILVLLPLRHSSVVHLFSGPHTMFRQFPLPCIRSLIYDYRFL